MIRSFFIVFSVLLLTGCGVRGGLEVPPPLFGEADGPPPPVPDVYENEQRRSDETFEAALPSGELVTPEQNPEADPFAEGESADGDS